MMKSQKRLKFRKGEKIATRTRKFFSLRVSTGKLFRKKRNVSRVKRDFNFGDNQFKPDTSAKLFIQLISL